MDDGESQESNRDERPVFIQGSNASIFRGRNQNGQHFGCVKCGHLIIEHYYPDCFANLGMKCFACGEVSWTPPLDDGDVMCSRILMNPDGARVLIGGTVDYDSFVTVASQSDVEREQRLARPSETNLPIDMSDPELGALIASYDAIVGNKFALQRAKLERGGFRNKTMFPFAWAVSHISECLKRQHINLFEEETANAFSCVRLYAAAVGSWSHHPRFMQVARDLGKQNSFYHTSGQLLFAWMLAQHNRIGLSLENRHGEPNPDLYLKGINGGRFYIEVKAPTVLDWSATITDPNQIYAAIGNQVDQSRKQINAQNKGILAIFATRREAGFVDTVQDAVKVTLDRVGSLRRHLAGVMTLLPEPESMTICGHSIRGPELVLRTLLNPGYEGKNPLELVEHVSERLGA